MGKGERMKEKPIIFSTKMVKAILEGRKIQTRRIAKPQPDKVIPLLGKPGIPWWKLGGISGGKHRYFIRDILWVKETWRLWEGQTFDSFHGDPLDPDILDGKLSQYDKEWLKKKPREYKASTHSDGPWRSSLYMPRWVARIFLEVTGVRFEWLQNISESDAISEGVEQLEMVDNTIVWKDYGKGFYLYSARGSFASLWDSLYLKRGYGWDENPLVEVVNFKIIEG
jgi:hypothetical protein